MKSICQGLLVRHAEQAQLQRVTIDLSLCAEPAIVIGFERSLSASLDRLVRRALTVTPAGSRLVIRVERRRYVTVELMAPAPMADVPGGDAAITGHNGLLWHERQRDGGTRFTVELPAAGPTRPIAA